jgi:hypothetical protein
MAVSTSSSLLLVCLLLGEVHVRIEQLARRFGYCRAKYRGRQQVVRRNPG